jgi:hypothetical protein
LAIGSIDEFARRLPAPGSVDVSIEILSDDIGDQIQVQRLPWNALVYDSAASVLELSVGGHDRSLPVVFRHEIHDPTRVWVEEDGGSVKTMSIEQADGVQTIVRFFKRQALQPGS